MANYRKTYKSGGSIRHTTGGGGRVVDSWGPKRTKGGMSTRTRAISQAGKPTKFVRINTQTTAGWTKRTTKTLNPQKPGRKKSPFSKGGTTYSDLDNAVVNTAMGGIAAVGGLMALGSVVEPEVAMGAAGLAALGYGAKKFYNWWNKKNASVEVAYPEEPVSNETPRNMPNLTGAEYYSVSQLKRDIARYNPYGTEEQKNKYRESIAWSYIQSNFPNKSESERKRILKNVMSDYLKEDAPVNSVGAGLKEGYLTNFLKNRLTDKPLEKKSFDERPDYVSSKEEKDDESQFQKHAAKFQYEKHHQKALDLYAKNSKHKHMKALHKNLSDAIKSHTTDRDMYVHRAMTPDEIDDYDKKTGERTLKGHTSTSYDPNRAQDRFQSSNKDPNKNGMIRIKVPKGSHVAHVAKGEQEFLLHHGAKIKINSDKVRNSKYYKSHRYQDAELVDDGSSSVNEDAPVNSVGAGQVAGLGVGPKGEPGRGGPLLRRKKFAGHTVFEVSSKIFHTARMSKRKGQHWRTYLEEDDCFQEIREYANAHPNEAVVLQNEATGEMCFVRYPKSR
jgi:hypothetical protein